MKDREKLVKLIMKWLKESHPDDSDSPSYLVDTIMAWHKSEVEEKLKPIKDAFIHGEEDFATATYDYPSIQDLYLAVHKVCANQPTKGE